MAIFTFLKTSLRYGLIEEDSCHLISATTFNLLPYIVLFEEHKNLASCIYAVRKARNILVAFLDNCAYSFLISHQNSKQ